MWRWGRKGGRRGEGRKGGRRWRGVNINIVRIEPDEHMKGHWNTFITFE